MSGCIQPARRVRVLGLISVGALYLAMFAGRFSLERFAIWPEYVPAPDLRAIGILIAAIIYVVFFRATVLPQPRIVRPAWLFFLVVSLFYGYVVLNALLWGASGQVQLVVADALATMAALMLAAFLLSRREWLDDFARVSQAFGVLLALLAASGMGNPDLNGVGWAPIGGPISFYRLEFFAACASLYLMLRSGHVTWRVFHFACALLALYATLASLSKAALLGMIVALALIFVVWYLRRYFRHIIFLVIAVFIVGTVFQLTKGALMQSRITVGITPTVIAESFGDEDLLMGDLVISYRGDMDYEMLPDHQKRRLKALSELFHDAGAPDYRQDPAALVRWAARFVLLSDGSNRIGMAQNALKAFRERPLTGIGPGRYAYWTINPYKLEPEQYSYPHNIVLEVLSVTGLVGFVLFSWSVFIGYVSAVRTQWAWDESLPFIAYSVFVAVTALFSGDLYDFRLFWFSLMMVLVFSGVSKSPDSD